MAKFLRDLLGAREPNFTNALRGLERATGHDGVDVGLITEIMQKAHDVMRKIGLDPADSTARELYSGLQAHASREELFASTEYVGLRIEDEVVSFNLADVRENDDLLFERRTCKGMQTQLRNELIRRYIDHARTDEDAVRAFARDAMLDQALELADLQKTDMFVNDSRPYVVCIGDIFTDAFIELRKDKARIDTDPDGSKRLSMEFGSKPPYERVDIVQAVGPSPNAAVSMSRLGLSVGLMSFLGDDQSGRDSVRYLHDQRVDTSLTTYKKDTKSNYYYVLRYGAERTILVKNENYDYKWLQPARIPSWIYLSLISEASWKLHTDMLDYLDKHPETKLAFQPGTFHFEWGADKLSRVYARSYIVIMNREEAVSVTGASYDSVADLATGLHRLGPKIVVITDGPHGSYASDGEKLFLMPNYPDPAPPYDRTGAGDAFASTIVAMLALGETLGDAMCYAPVNSMSVVQQLGAQAGLLSRQHIDEWLRKAPPEYQLKELS